MEGEPLSFSTIRAPLLVAAAFLPLHVAAAIFEAGPDASPPFSIQGAIDAAIAAGGDDEVRVQGVPFDDVPPIEVPATHTGGMLHISGGWDATFTVQSEVTPSLVDGDGTGRVFRLRPSGGTVVLEDLTISGGAAPSGAGVQVDPSGDARVEIRGCTLEQNQAENGAGLAIFLGATQVVVVQGNRIEDNLAFSPDSTASGGGIILSAGDSSEFRLHDNEIVGNTASAPANQATGAGIYATWCEAASGEMTDNLVQGNDIVGEGSQVASGGALWQSTFCTDPTTGNVRLRRNRWLGGIASSAAQVSVISSGSGSIAFTDSLVAGGSADGLELDARDTSVLHVTNVTIADQGGSGVTGFEDAGATMTFFNGIVFGNGTDQLPGSSDDGNNLVGVDPLFVGTSYKPGAPAIDAGTPSPPGGLGPADLLGNPRTVGAAPDIGAIEAPEAGASWAGFAAAATLGGLAARRRRELR
jgi:hypothetical protein